MKQAAAWGMCIAAVAVVAGAAQSVHAQATPPGVVRDGTIGPGAETQPTGSNFVITEQMGERPDNGPNLFHSFDRFSLRDTPAGRESAHFQAGPGVDNILARVTGGERSDIDGRLGADANLYLMNPAGIVFGPNASLDVNGSFHATTADGIRLGETGHFEADKTRPSVLSVAPPAAFGFLKKTAPAAAIEVNGAQLSLRSRESFSIVGGQVRLGDGFHPTTVAASGGNIRLTAVGSGEVEVAPASEAGALLEPLPAGAGIAGGEVLVDHATIGRGKGFSSFAPGAAGVLIEGDSIMVGDSSSLDASGDGFLGFRAGGTVRLRASSALEVRGSIIANGGFNEAFQGRSGGRIVAEAGSIFISESGLLSARGPFGAKGGDLSLLAIGPLEVHGSIRGNGNGGRIVAEGDSILVGTPGSLDASGFSAFDNGGKVSLSAGGALEVRGRVRATGIRGGSIGLDGERVWIRGPGLSDSGEFLGVSADGAPGGSIRDAEAAGSIAVHARHFVMSTGAALSTIGIAASGQSGVLVRAGAGSIDIQAGSVELYDGATIISQGLGPTSVKDAGVSIQAADRIEASGDSKIVSFGADGAGTLLRAPEVILDHSVIGRPTDVIRGVPDVDQFGRPRLDNNGRPVLIPVNVPAAPGSGALTVEADRLVLRNGAGLEGSTSSALGGGQLTVSAQDAVVLTGTGTGIRSLTTGSGAGGAIQVSSPAISLSDGAEISASSSGAGRAGAITLDASRVSLTGGASIAARSSSSADAGSVSVRSLDAIQLKRSRITTEALQGSGGNISLMANRLIELRGSDVTASVTSGSGGNITIDPTFVILAEGSRIIAQAREGSGGNIRITADVLIQSLDSVISASSQLGTSGTVAIDSPQADLAGQLSALPAVFLDGAALLRQRCAQRQGQSAGYFVVAAEASGGTSPEGQLLSVGLGPLEHDPGTMPGGLVLGEGRDGQAVALVVTCPQHASM